MATLSKGQTFGATETVTNTKLHNLVDLASISGIVNADVSASAAIDSSKLDLSSAGYLTTGGNFDVTGRHTHADLSWFNTGSLASINTARVQTMMLTSLISVADARLKDTIGDTARFASIASIAQGDIALAHIYSLASIANPLHYTALVGSLASGALPTYDGAALLVGRDIADIAPSSLSNVIFAWSGVDNVSAAAYGFYNGTSLTGDPDTTNAVYAYLINDTTTFQTMLNFQFTKISGISTVTIHARLWAGDTGADEAELQVDIGGQSNTVKSVTSATPTWVTTSTIDVSGLSDGTTYNGIVQLRNEGAGSNAYCSAVTLVAS